MQHPRNRGRRSSSSSINRIEVLGQSYATEEQALAALKGEVVRLEAQKRVIEDARLAQLPAEFGFASIDDLILRLAELGSPVLRRRLAEPGAAPDGFRRRHTRLTAVTISPIVTALTGDPTGAAVATQFGVSLPTVHAIKKSAGLTRSRSPR